MRSEPTATNYRFWKLCRFRREAFQKSHSKLHFCDVCIFFDRQFAEIVCGRSGLFWANCIRVRCLSGCYTLPRWIFTRLILLSTNLKWFIICRVGR